MKADYSLDTRTKVALITGGSRRLGAAICRVLHSHGFNIVIHYSQSKNDATQLASQLNRKRENSAITIQAELVHGDTDELICSAASCWGRLDLLVNNASSFYPTNMDQITDPHWDNLMGTNLKAPLFLAKQAAGYLKATGGNIINLIDIHYRYPMPNHIIYSVAKTGLAGLTRSLALELAPDIRVNGIAPGAILWPESHEGVDYAKRLANIPLRKTGQPEDIAEGVYFLSQANYITGEIIHIDGGRSIAM